MTVPLPPKLYFRIGEVAGLVGVEPHVLRYWEREFRSIRPTKSAKGQRVYSRKDVEALIVVKDLLYAQGFTIAGAKKRLQRTPEPLHVAPPAATPAAATSADREEHDREENEHEAEPERAPERRVDQAPPMLLGRHAEEALLRTLDQPGVRAPNGHAVARAARPNGARVGASSEVEGTRRVLISLRAEVEALLSELGG